MVFYNFIAQKGNKCANLEFVQFNSLGHKNAKFSILIQTMITMVLHVL